MDNPGAYLTAYLADMELNEAFDVHGIGIDGSELKEAKVYDEQSKKWIAKRIVINPLITFTFHVKIHIRGC